MKQNPNQIIFPVVLFQPKTPKKTETPTHPLPLVLLSLLRPHLSFNSLAICRTCRRYRTTPSSSVSSLLLLFVGVVLRCCSSCITSHHAGFAGTSHLGSRRCSVSVDVILNQYCPTLTGDGSHIPCWLCDREGGSAFVLFPFIAVVATSAFSLSPVFLSVLLSLLVVVVCWWLKNTKVFFFFSHVLSLLLLWFLLVVGCCVIVVVVVLLLLLCRCCYRVGVLFYFSSPVL